MIVYMENPISSIIKLLNLISEFTKVAGYKVNIQKSMTFWYTNNELSETETKKEIPFIIATKIIKCLGITSTRKVKELYSVQKKKKKNL